MGSPDKVVAENERETVIIQRRCLRAARDIAAREELDRAMIDVLRPATPGAILPDQVEKVIGLKAISDIPAGKELRWGMLSE
jgi:N-acetylneuraminate synthase